MNNGAIKSLYPPKNNASDERTGYVGFSNILIVPGYTNLAGRDEIYTTPGGGGYSNSVVINSIPLTPLAVADASGIQSFGNQLSDGRLGRDVLMEEMRIVGQVGVIPYDWKSLRLMVVCFDENSTLGVAGEEVAPPSTFLYEHSTGHKHADGHFSFQKTDPGHRILFDKFYDLNVFINSDTSYPYYYHGTNSTSTAVPYPVQHVVTERSRRSFLIDELVPLNIRTRFGDDDGTPKNISRGLIVAYFLAQDYDDRLPTSQDLQDQFFGTIVTKYRV